MPDEPRTIPPALGGETSPNDWYFNRIGEVGPLPNPVGHTFPLLTHDADGKWELVGTGFYINQSGLFVTARHVVDQVLRDGRQIRPLTILHLRSDSGLFGPSSSTLRPIRQVWLAEIADVAVGLAGQATNKVSGAPLNAEWAWTLSWDVPRVGSIAATYAFPNSRIPDGHHLVSVPNVYAGRVTEVADRRDSVMLPFPYFQVDARIHGAASGGPMQVGNFVAGINCMELVGNPPGPAYATQSRCVGEAFFDDVCLPGESQPRRVTFDELVAARALNVAGYKPRPPGSSESGRLVHFSIHATAPAPNLTIVISA